MNDGTEVLDPKARKLADAFIDTWKTSIRPELHKHNVGYFMVVIYPDDNPDNSEKLSGGNAMGIFTNIFADDQERVLRDALDHINSSEYKFQKPVPTREN